MSILAFLAGMAAVLVPLLYAFAMVAAWALIRNDSVRRGVLLFMGAIAIVVPGKVILELRATRDREQALSAHCESSPEPQIISRIGNVHEMIADYDYYQRLADGPSRTGESAFPIYIASRLLLSGVVPLQRFAIRAGDQYEIYSIGPDSGELRMRQESPAAFQYGYSWVANDLSNDKSVSSATLVVKDLSRSKVLGALPVFVTTSPGVKAFPSLWSTPTPVQPEAIHSCPRAEEIVAFLNSVLIPASSGSGSQ